MSDEEKAFWMSCILSVFAWILSFGFLWIATLCDHWLMSWWFVFSALFCIVSGLSCVWAAVSFGADAAKKRREKKQ